MPTQTTPRSFKENLLSFGMLVAVLLFFSFGSYFVNVLAQTPPTGNFAAPINTGDATQTKTGILHLNNYLGGNGEPVLYGRAPGSNETLLFFANGKSFKIRETGSSSENPIVTVNSGGLSLSADLNMNSAGITLGGVRRTTWPDGGSGEQLSWGETQHVSVTYSSSNARLVSCPRGYFMTGVATKRNQNQGDNYISMLYCTKIDGLYVPQIPGEELPPPDNCEPDPGNPDTVICPA